MPLPACALYRAEQENIFFQIHQPCSAALHMYLYLLSHGWEILAQEIEEGCTRLHQLGCIVGLHLTTVTNVVEIQNALTCS